LTKLHAALSFTVLGLVKISPRCCKTSQKKALPKKNLWGVLGTNGFTKQKWSKQKLECQVEGYSSVLARKAIKKSLIWHEKKRPSQ